MDSFVVHTVKANELVENRILTPEQASTIEYQAVGGAVGELMQMVAEAGVKAMAEEDMPAARTAVKCILILETFLASIGVPLPESE